MQSCFGYRLSHVVYMYYSKEILCILNIDRIVIKNDETKSIFIRVLIFCHCSPCGAISPISRQLIEMIQHIFVLIVVKSLCSISLVW